VFKGENLTHSASEILLIKKSLFRLFFILRGIYKQMLNCSSAFVGSLFSEEKREASRFQVCKEQNRAEAGVI
jgi:hypothetical protein